MIDSHAHLQDEKFENLEEIVTGAKSANVNKIICASCDVKTSAKAVDFSEKYKDVYATVGVHPHEANGFSENTVNELENLAKNKKVVAIGEIGLDYYYNFSSKEDQKKAFLMQIDLANKLKLPIVVHSREATADTLNILKQNFHKLKNGVCIHCFNMSLEILKEINKLGFYISIGGIVTFKNANNVLTIAKECDLSKLMLETDCPYLSPEPYRYKINKPEYVVYSAQKIADLKNVTLKELDEVTTQNTLNFFKIKE